MQQISACGDNTMSAYVSVLPQKMPRQIAGSKSLASMLPTILSTGVITLVATAVMRLLWLGFSNDFFGAWMEAWLTTWPIAFPVAYMLRPVLNRVSRSVSQPVVAAALPVRQGLTVTDIQRAAAEATRIAGLQVKSLPARRY
ncbi:DUF2798 domain-containing protein [Undibacterium sp. FT31W]|uniref:DUF2798 domain-containing protein n=2 Tax=Undibacterium griseum TaxID=2762295 RepID=A0ABR6YI60_9BURK|nr:DUF2798 domain-containing protein [Undibacterium griseum]